MLGVSKLSQSEHQMHLIRWGLTIGWVVMIFSLFWNPFAAFLANPENIWSPFRFEPNQCILVQGNCLVQKPYAIASFVFWSLIVPTSILILLVLGHETWRRICPLSFLSQIPRALGIQRKRKSENSKTGAVRYELVKVRKDSWLGKNHLYVQFGLLAIGLAIRLLFVNADSIALGIFLVATILIAIAIGYLYEGKSWCQYFCPMAPVQMVFNGPRGLLGSEAHQGQKQAVTQSMCRIVDKEGKEKSACVGCQSPCIDIDAERNYWETFSKPGYKFVRYGYVGLLLAYFLYYFLYAGNFDYLFTGAWLREANQLGALFSPGFYIFDRPIPIPKIVAVPLTLALLVALSYFALSGLEKVYRSSFKEGQRLSQQQISHIIFSLCTFASFNLFFAFTSRSLLGAAPLPVQLVFNGFLVLVSTLWLARTLDRSSDRYTRESLANTLRRQLSKLTVDFSRFLEGRSMDDLKPEEVYVLAKVLPGFSQENSLQVYKGVLRETLEQGNADSASSLEVLKQIRQELNIKEEDHFSVLTELGAAEPELLDPKKRRTRESQLRIESYRQTLASMLLALVDGGMSLQEAVQRQKKQIQFLKLEYGMTSEEEDAVLSQLLAGEKSTILRKAEMLQEQLRELALRYKVLSHANLEPYVAVFDFLRLIAVQHKQQILIKQMLGLLEVLGDAPDAIVLAKSTRAIAVQALPEILQSSEGSSTWKQRLKPEVFAALENTASDSNLTTSIERLESSESLITVLDELTHELDPLVQSLALHGLNLLAAQKATDKAKQLLNSDSKGHWLVKETAQNLLNHARTDTESGVLTLVTQTTIAGQTETQLFQQPVVRVGSSPVNDIVIDRPEVAQHHAIFFLDSEDYSVLDLGCGGVYLGEKFLSNNRDRLVQGQTVRLSKAADSAITVHWEKQRLQTQVLTEEMGTIEKVLLLFESRFFKSLKPDALIELGHSAAVKIYTQGEQMCEAGAPSDSILLLVDGVADVVVLRGAEEQVVGTVNKGETIGEMGVLTRQRRSASVVAASEYCRSLIIQADKFDGVLRQDPEVARNLLVVLSSRLQSMTSKVR
ncbi:MAG TPA: cyclic nucleotide-binding domain-containing protein [Thermosynechococcaceae cyanobacterium]